jgi:hypothetical protein
VNVALADRLPTPPGGAGGSMRAGRQRAGAQDDDLVGLGAQGLGQRPVPGDDDDASPARPLLAG